MDDQLKDYEKTTLATISPLQIVSNELHDRAEQQKIETDTDLKAANEVKKDINTHSKQVKDLRLALTRPADDFKERMIAKENEILAPLKTAKDTLGKKIMAYEDEQERKRVAEERRVDALVAQVSALYKPGMTANQVEAGKVAAKKLRDELGDDARVPRVTLAFVTLSNNFIQRTQDIQIEEQRAKKQKLQDDQQKIDAENARIKADEERQAAELAQQEANKAAARATAARPKSNIREYVEYEITDPDQVPRELCSPDSVKINAYKAEWGDNLVREDGPGHVGGIRFFKTRKVA